MLLVRKTSTYKRTVTSQYPFCYDLKCCQDVKQQQNKQKDKQHQAFYRLFVDECKLTEKVRKHLSGEASDNEGTVKVKVYPYEDVREKIAEVIEKQPGKTWVGTFFVYMFCLV